MYVYQSNRLLSINGLNKINNLHLKNQKKINIYLYGDKVFKLKLKIMFNGIIKNNAIIKKISYKEKACELIIKSKNKLKSIRIGDSVCCNGVCLTVIKKNGNYLKFFVSNETLKNPILSKQKRGFNKYRNFLKYGDEISGHYVQGHVDCTSKVKNIFIKNKTWFVDLLINKNFIRYLKYKSSISLNGVSLTITKVTNTGFQVSIIPHTLKLTNLKDLKKYKHVNTEIDIFGKYILG